MHFMITAKYLMANGDNVVNYAGCSHKEHDEYQ